MAQMAAEQKPENRPFRLPRLNMYQQESLAGYLCVSIWVIGFLIFSLGPMLATVVLSFYKWDLIRDPRFIDVENYVKLFNDDLFWQGLFRHSGAGVAAIDHVGAAVADADGRLGCLGAQHADLSFWFAEHCAGSLRCREC